MRDTYAPECSNSVTPRSVIMCGLLLLIQLRTTAASASIIAHLLTPVHLFVCIAQVPWIMAGTVRDNITFGSAWDDAWYHRVVGVGLCKGLWVWMWTWMRACDGSGRRGEGMERVQHACHL